MTADDKERMGEILDLVEHACSAILTSVDWGVTMIVIERVNVVSHPVILSRIVGRLTKNLSRRAARGTVMNTLTLCDMLVQNCHSEFHRALAVAPFMKAMTALALSSIQHRDGSEEDQEISYKARELIRCWGEAFRRGEDRAVAPLFCDTYRQLIEGGVVEFPRDEDYGAIGRRLHLQSEEEEEHPQPGDGEGAGGGDKGSLGGDT